MTLLLRPLSPADEPVARQVHAELAGDDFELLLDLRDGEPWADYLARLESLRWGQDVPVDRVPAAFLVAEVNGELVGRVSVRYELNAYLARIGGHIGYGIRPGARRRGYATEVLRQALELLRVCGVDRALVTCDDANVGSATVIERCGGVLTDRPEVDGVLRRHYWVELAPGPTSSPTGTATSRTLPSGASGQAQRGSCAQLGA